MKDNIVYRTTDGLGSTRYIKNDEWCTEEEAYPDTSCESCGRFVEIDENDPDACKVCGR